MPPIITAENVSKKYIINHKRQEAYPTLRDTIVEKTTSLWKKNPVKESKEEFWALKNVNFEINPGERVGIIGKNGAGKSTILKILSRITDPSGGRITLRGRVASLLEVGTGFNPELTGRENIFLNGAILGMRREEIKRKFDEIVSFAEVEKFLDTPVKRYSSGMYVRLAFAIAAHLEPEVLIVDEVLAVGDAEFQKKSLGKMEDVGKEGRTVIFVSHNMGAIEQLCERVILLKAGEVEEESRDVIGTINKYMYSRDNQNETSWQNSDKLFDNEWFVPKSLVLIDEKGQKITSSILARQKVNLQIKGELLEKNPGLSIGYALYGEDGNFLYASYDTDQKQDDWPKLDTNNLTLTTELPTEILNEGLYRIELIASIYNVRWIFEPGRHNPYIMLNIQGGLSESPYWLTKRPGLLAPLLKWK
jgi:lipopolysaccharide transport system ATP-binding protein